MFGYTSTARSTAHASCCCWRHAESHAHRHTYTCVYTPATIVPTLQADINLHVATGATVKFSSVPADYLKEGLVLTRFEGPPTV